MHQLKQTVSDFDGDTALNSMSSELCAFISGQAGLLAQAPSGCASMSRAFNPFVAKQTCCCGASFIRGMLQLLQECFT